jgi:formate-dependent nitrite reductase membrane component NrfD
LKYIAAGGLMGLTNGLWTASASVFSNMMNSLNNPVLPAIFTGVSIAMGVCVALLVLGIFTSQEQLT